MEANVTTRTLLDLRIGTVIKATLRSGRQITGKLVSPPRLSSAGKPGIHRVRLDVRDVDTQISDNASLWTAVTKGRHTVSGDRVTEIVG